MPADTQAQAVLGNAITRLFMMPHMRSNSPVLLLHRHLHHFCSTCCRGRSIQVAVHIARKCAYTQSLFKRNGNKRNEYLGVRKKCSTHFFGVRNAILAGSEIKEKTGPRRLKYRMAHVAHVYVTQHRSRSTGTVSGGHGRVVLYSLV
jgi:hypothetical protein